jgi:hypothetical protein
MTEAEFRQIERQLGLKLPAAYRKIMRDFPEDLADWPPPPGETENRRIEDFLLDVDEIVKAQKAARKRLREPLPPHSFVFGRSGDDFWLIDTSKDNPRVDLVFDEMILDGPSSLAAHLKKVRSNHKQAWAKARRRTGAGARATLTPDALIAEGWRLARPAVLLVGKGSEYAAVWKGPGVVTPPKGRWEHWVSIAARFLPDNPRKLGGILSVYLCTEDSDRFHQVAVVHDRNAKLPPRPKGRRLFARRTECPPPMEALFKFGSRPIQEWLRANGVDPNHGYSPELFSDQDQAALKAYEKVVAAEHPFEGRAGCCAMLGGWSWCFLWCYGSNEGYPWHLFKKALVVLTVREEEPWLEVYDDGKKFVTFSRIM